MSSKCVDPRGNRLCTNGIDTYHEWNSREAGSCYFCTAINNSWSPPYKPRYRGVKVAMTTLLVGLFIGTIGQFVWGGIFWNSPLFMHHWTMGLVGMVLCVPSAVYIACKVVDF